MNNQKMMQYIMYCKLNSSNLVCLSDWLTSRIVSLPRGDVGDRIILIPLTLNSIQFNSIVSSFGDIKPYCIAITIHNNTGSNY